MAEQVTSKKCVEDLIASLESELVTPYVIDTRPHAVLTLDQCRDVISALRATAEPPAGPPWEFDRYVRGQLKAEGIGIEREKTFERACIKAALLAQPHDVLVYRQAPPPGDGYYTFSQISYALNRVMARRFRGALGVDVIVADLHQMLADATPTKFSATGDQS